MAGNKAGHDGTKQGPGHLLLSNPWLMNFCVRLFSVTVRTTWSGAPDGISASLALIGTPAAPALVAALADDHPAVRQGTAAALGRIRPRPLKRYRR